jgi:hypothetical protein
MYRLYRRKDGRAGTTPRLLSRGDPRIQLNEHIEEDGALVFEHACKLAFEGIGSKRKGSPYRLRPLAALAQEQEPGIDGGEAGRMARADCGDVD